MKIETKYDIDDKVWILDRNWTRLKRPCTFCQGSGVITGVDKTIIGCPQCSGIGYSYRKVGELRWMVLPQIIILGIKSEGRMSAKQPHIITSYQVMDIADRISYAQPVEEGNVFRTKKEAQKEADRRNKIGWRG